MIALKHVVKAPFWHTKSKNCLSCDRLCPWLLPILSSDLYESTTTKDKIYFQALSWLRWYTQLHLLSIVNFFFNLNHSRHWTNCGTGNSYSTYWTQHGMLNWKVVLSQLSGVGQFCWLSVGLPVRIWDLSMIISIAAGNFQRTRG